MRVLELCQEIVARVAKIREPISAKTKAVVYHEQESLSIGSSMSHFAGVHCACDGALQLGTSGAALRRNRSRG